MVDMRKIKTKILAFWRTTYANKKIFIISFFLCGIFSIVIRFVSYKQISIYFGNYCQRLIASTLISKEQLQQARLIQHLIILVEQYTPWNTTCLAKALVARFWCKYYDISYMFFIGLAIKESSLSMHDAHAWIMAGPIALSGSQCFDTHHIIASYSNKFSL